MQRVADGVWLDKAGKSTEPRPVAVVIVFGWMDANVRHLKKYGDWYRKEKNLSVLYVESQQSHVLRSAATTARVLAPVRPILAEYGVVADDSSSAGAKPTASCFVHVFSDGGSRSLKTFTDVLQSQNHTLNAAGIVFVRAFTAPIKNPIARPIAVALLSVLFSALRLFHFITGSPDSTEKSRRALLEPRRLGAPSEVGSLPPRLYQYSESDELILYQAVEAHAEAARRLGAPVTLKNWKDTPHVRHMQADPAAYWEAVTKLFDQAEQHAVSPRSEHVKPIH
ncbi:hypothetical protein HDU89_007585 [Geranomyces variabilis]|nr:hypothetical protein HDU89_007585 [Geranomyces variabilis]